MGNRVEREGTALPFLGGRTSRLANLRRGAAQGRPSRGAVRPGHPSAVLAPSVPGALGGAGEGALWVGSYLASTSQACRLPGPRPGTAAAAAERIRLLPRRRLPFICSVSSSFPGLVSLPIAAAASSWHQPGRSSLTAPCSHSPSRPPASWPPTRRGTESQGPPRGRALLGSSSPD